MIADSPPADDDVQANFRHALDDLAEVAAVEEIALPDLPYEAVARTISGAEIGAAFDELAESGGLSGLASPEGRYKPYARDAILAVDYLRAVRLRAEMCRRVDALLAGYDALAAPATRAAAPTIDRDPELDDDGPPDVVGAIGNACGLPAVVVPSGFSGEGLPTGVQFVGRAYDENAALAVARAYQERTGWHLRRPPGVVP